MSAAEKTKQDNSISKKLLSKELYYDFKFPDTVFRRVVKDDIPEIISLHDVLFPVKYSDSFFNSLIRRDDMHTILAFSVEDGVLTGVSTARIEEKSESCYAIREGYISTLGVKPGYRRHGLGKFLLEKTVELLEKQQSCSAIKLHVKADNIPAINLYYKTGFELLEHLVNHYYFDGKRHDALHLVRYVRPPPPRVKKDPGLFDRCTIL
uniref:N-alpha-acetyltransferase 60 n=1 Tax=Lotharella oceanica TaxID=641309 RepID=A0A7S2U2D6_9EUKA|mmetsp:Transcript_6521/g.12929  ORF Transcript_6521/g.12929 Transcript_6521/m.12929 type:complete len:208 (+) Transcript_6521:43-666(+)